MRLNRTAYAIMRQAQLHDGEGAGDHLSVDTYEWLCGRNEFPKGGDREKIIPLKASTGNALRNRQDIGRMWGGLLEYIFHEKQTKAIESDEPRIPLLTHFLGYWVYPAGDHSSRNENPKRVPATPEFVRWLQGRKWEEFHGKGKFQFERMHEAFTVAAALPAKWRPRNATDWKVYTRSEGIIKGIASLLERDISEVALAIAHIFNRKSDYPDRALKRKETVQEAFAANFDKDSGFGNLSDFLSAVPAQIILPALVQEAQSGGYPIPHQDNIHQWSSTDPISAQNNYSYITGRLARDIFRGMTVNDLVKFANRWHQKLNRIQTRSMKLDGTYEWAPLFKGTLTTADGKVDMNCLTSTAELVYAGKTLENCVGGYTFKCVQGRSHIVQLENRDTLEQALLELQDVETEEDNKCFVVRQLQLESPSNQAAAPWAVAAARELIERVNENTEPDQISDLSALNEERKRLRDKTGMDILMIKAGFDPFNREYADNAYHVFHHEMREMFPEETRAQFLEARGIAAQIPGYLKKQQEWNRPRR